MEVFFDLFKPLIQNFESATLYQKLELMDQTSDRMFFIPKGGSKLSFMLATYQSPIKTRDRATIWILLDIVSFSIEVFFNLFKP